jgi:hypothetical protein
MHSTHRISHSRLGKADLTLTHVAHVTMAVYWLERSKLDRRQIQLAFISDSELLYEWRFTTNNFGLESSRLRLATGDFFPTERLWSEFLCNTHTDERMDLTLSCLPKAHKTCYWKFFLFAIGIYTQVTYQFRICKADHGISYLSYAADLSLWTVTSLTRRQV